MILGFFVREVSASLSGSLVRLEVVIIRLHLLSKENWFNDKTNFLMVLSSTLLSFVSPPIFTATFFPIRLLIFGFIRWASLSSVACVMRVSEPFERIILCPCDVSCSGIINRSKCLGFILGS